MSDDSKQKNTVSRGSIVDLTNRYFGAPAGEESASLATQIQETIPHLKASDRLAFSEFLEASGSFAGFAGEFNHLEQMEKDGNELAQHGFKLEKDKERLEAERVAPDHQGEKKSARNRSHVTRHLKVITDIETINKELGRIAEEINQNEQESELLKAKIRDEYIQVILPLANTAEKRKELLKLIKGCDDLAFREQLLCDKLVEEYLAKKKKYVAEHPEVIAETPAATTVAANVRAEEVMADEQGDTDPKIESAVSAETISEETATDQPAPVVTAVSDNRANEVSLTSPKVDEPAVPAPVVENGVDTVVNPHPDLDAIHLFSSLSSGPKDSDAIFPLVEQLNKLRESDDIAA